MECTVLLTQRWLALKKTMKGLGHTGPRVAFLSNSVASAVQPNLFPSWTSLSRHNLEQSLQFVHLGLVIMTDLSITRINEKMNVFILLPDYLMRGCQPVYLWICKEVDAIGALNFSKPQLFKVFVFLFIKQIGGPWFSDFSHLKWF